MSTTPLSKSREIIDRSLFHSIRKELVDKGYLPDIDARVEATITALDQVLKTFSVTGNVSLKYTVGKKFEILLSTGNNAIYTIVSAIFTTPLTVITVTENIPNITADGKVSLLFYYNDALGVLEYKNDIATICTNLGFAIEVFGASNSQAKYLKKIPRIVILPNQSLSGSLGGSPDRVYTPNNGDLLAPDAFTAKVLPPETTDFSYDICLVANTAEQSRILHAIVSLALPKRGYVKFYNDSLNQFFIIQFSYRSIPNTIEGIIEDIYMYEVRDIYETECAIVGTLIKPITEITLDTNIGDEGSPTKFNDKIII